ncbi:MAG: hypothetical protein H7281_04850 [Bacteriovorax sp.]|nr:hypothetical protein [Bacteriovorax sp.]
MIILKTVLILALVIPAIANNIDDEIIKNLDFFQSMDLIKDENPFAYKNAYKVNKNDDQLNILKDVLLKDGDVNVEKKQ